MTKFKINSPKAVIVAFILLVALAITLVSSGNAATAFAASDALEFKKKVYWTDSINEEFDDSSVIIVMELSLNATKKEHGQKRIIHDIIK